MALSVDTLIYFAKPFHKTRHIEIHFNNQNCVNHFENVQLFHLALRRAFQPYPEKKKIKVMKLTHRLKQNLTRYSMWPSRLKCTIIFDGFRARRLKLYCLQHRAIKMNYNRMLKNEATEASTWHFMAFGKIMRFVCHIDSINFIESNLVNAHQKLTFNHHTVTTRIFLWLYICLSLSSYCFFYFYETSCCFFSTWFSIISSAQFSKSLSNVILKT